MTKFDWTHKSYEFVNHDTVIKNITFKHDKTYDTTRIFDESGRQITSVWTDSGDTNRMPEYQGSRYVRPAVDPLLSSMSDETLANYFRNTDTQLVNAYHELRRRGYTIDSENDFDIDVTPIKRIYKTITTEQEI